MSPPPPPRRHNKSFIGGGRLVAAVSCLVGYDDHNDSMIIRRSQQQHEDRPRPPARGAGGGAARRPHQEREEGFLLLLSSSYYHHHHHPAPHLHLSSHSTSACIPRLGVLLLLSIPPATTTARQHARIRSPHGMLAARRPSRVLVSIIILLVRMRISVVQIGVRKQQLHLRHPTKGQPPASLSSIHYSVRAAAASCCAAFSASSSRIRRAVSTASAGLLA